MGTALNQAGRAPGPCLGVTKHEFALVSTVSSTCVLRPSTFSPLCGDTWYHECWVHTDPVLSLWTLSAASVQRSETLPAPRLRLSASCPTFVQKVAAFRDCHTYWTICSSRVISLTVAATIANEYGALILGQEQSHLPAVKLTYSSQPSRRQYCHNAQFREKETDLGQVHS